jgi:hypothetical protein
MSLDQKIESVSNSLFSTLLSFLPTFAITGGMKLYILAYDSISALGYQTQRTVSAIKESFAQPILAFYKVGTQYMPVCIQNEVRYSNLPEWIYTPNTNEFSLMESDQANPIRIPFIAATLYHKKGDTEVELGDMSEWITNQTIYAPGGVIPLQVLVAAWMYSQSPPTLLMNYDDLYLKVMDDSAEETMYHVESEKEVEEIEEGEIVEESKASE